MGLRRHSAKPMIDAWGSAATLAWILMTALLVTVTIGRLVSESLPFQTRHFRPHRGCLTCKASLHGCWVIAFSLFIFFFVLLGELTADGASTRGHKTESGYTMCAWCPAKSDSLFVTCVAWLLRVRWQMAQGKGGHPRREQALSRAGSGCLSRWTASHICWLFPILYFVFFSFSLYVGGNFIFLFLFLCFGQWPTTFAFAHHSLFCGGVEALGYSYT